MKLRDGREVTEDTYRLLLSRYNDLGVKARITRIEPIGAVVRTWASFGREFRDSYTNNYTPGEYDLTALFGEE